ncbi:hypothetical protein H2509_19765 [Stappia sp. F7233]|uniref:Uncharacterized protein n=1 Tax=Stappia albiluteola TaxID=2758565 RepID=A0A839AI30_9HYPH|nr:hypothetical protein [Stappia albiluteola]MBA5779373.1 hypothetical protein [Stappia albiluteola]
MRDRINRKVGSSNDRRTAAKNTPVSPIFFWLVLAQIFILPLSGFLIPVIFTKVFAISAELQKITIYAVTLGLASLSIALHAWLWRMARAGGHTALQAVVLGLGAASLVCLALFGRVAPLGVAAGLLARLI